jgi:TolA-binding protein
MPIDEKKILQKLKEKDKEIIELKQLLAEAEQEIKELNDFHGLQKPRPGILESQGLNKFIKRTAYFLIAVAIIFIGVAPWLFKDKLLTGSNSGEQTAEERDTSLPEQTTGEESKADKANDTATTTAPAETKPAETPSATRDIFQPGKSLIVKSDLGWLNVRTKPSQEGDIIKKINSGEEVEWIEKTDNNWYRIKVDAEGHTGYVSGEYVEIK